jgi:hypothetical protein
MQLCFPFLSNVVSVCVCVCVFLYGNRLKYDLKQDRSQKLPEYEAEGKFWYLSQILKVVKQHLYCLYTSLIVIVSYISVLAEHSSGRPYLTSPNRFPSDVVQRVYRLCA